MLGLKVESGESWPKVTVTHTWSPFTVSNTSPPASKQNYLEQGTGIPGANGQIKEITVQYPASPDFSATNKA